RPNERIGQFTLTPIDLADWRRITLNADAANGAVRVEVLNEDGYRVRGFSKDDAVPLKEDGLDLPVRWKDRGLSDLRGGRCMLRIHLENATIYAISFGEKGGAP
ncbi:MAG TPA: hypothetical protein VM492_05800, partial [Sumerlaeia bacterium]|nr:hypothetical protein [Sumerlaeia bacterium]